MPSVSTSMTCAPRAFSQSIIFLQKIAADLRDARRRVEIGKVSLRETEIAVEAVDQNLEGVLQRVEICCCCVSGLSQRACCAFASSRKVRRSVSKCRKIWS